MVKSEARSFVVFASTLWILMHFRNFRNAPGVAPPTPPPHVERTRGTTNGSEAGCLLTDEWARAGLPARSPLLKQNASPPPLGQEPVEIETWQGLRQRWGMCICSAVFHSSVVSLIFLSFCLFLGAWVVNKAPDNRGASSCTCGQPDVQPSSFSSSSSYLVYVAVAALLPCYETSEHAALLWFPFFFCFCFLKGPLLLLLPLSVSSRSALGTSCDRQRSWHQLGSPSLTHPLG